MNFLIVKSISFAGKENDHLSLVPAGTERKSWYCPLAATLIVNFTGESIKSGSAVAAAAALPGTLT